MKTEFPEIPLFAIPEARTCRIVERINWFVAALPDVEGFTPHKTADPKLFDLLEKAKNFGVKIKAIGLYFRPSDSFVCLYDPDLDVVIRRR